MFAENKKTKAEKPCNCKKNKLKHKTGQQQPANDFYITDHLQEVAIIVPVSILTAVIMRRLFLVFGLVS